MRATPAATLTATLNDAFRSQLLKLRPVGAGMFTMTRGVAALPAPLVALVLQAVSTFDRFTPNNDPWHEHDFGALDVDGHRVFWKIDYYADSSCSAGAEQRDATCYRLLTIMLAEEY